MQIASADRDDASIQLERTISQDPGFSARLLTIANSPLYGATSNISTIKAGIMLLGIKGIRNLAMTVSAGDIFQCTTRQDALRAKMWWRLSCDSAVCARWLGRERRLSFSDEAYLAALLHSVGKMMIIHAAPETYHAVEDLVRSGSTVIEAEEAVYGTNHVQLTIKAIEEWGLPPSLISGVNYCTPPEPGEPYAGVRAITALGIAIGNPSGQNGHPVLPEWALEFIGESHLSAENVIEEGRCVLAAASRTN